MYDKPNQTAFEHPPYFLELELSRFVASGDADGAMSLIQRINTFKRAVLAGNSLRSLKNSLICNCTFLARAAIAGGVPVEEAFAASDKLIREIEDTCATHQLENLEQHHLAAFIRLVRQYKHARLSKSVREVVAYINGNLSEELNLKKIANVSGLSPNYLSALFKKEMGVRLSAYILNRRIESAKFYLCHTNNTILDISNFFQFSSQSHFTRLFSKYTGMTPLQYRNSQG